MFTAGHLVDNLVINRCTVRFLEDNLGVGEEFKGGGLSWEWE